MEITLTKRYRCAVCKQKEIKHQTTEHTYEGAVPDQSNCDLSSYSDSQVSGGRLFKCRPHVETDRFFVLPEDKQTPPTGGICSECLNNDIVKLLISANAISFDDNPKIFRAYA